MQEVSRPALVQLAQPALVQLAQLVASLSAALVLVASGVAPGREPVPAGLGTALVPVSRFCCWAPVASAQSSP
jgi:hypothetical protein